ncbi:MAG: response regulator [Leptolyngbyaceae bacterium]|nr:response regulator [Leptolyngbyaceae bacterium]
MTIFAHSQFQSDRLAESSQASDSQAESPADKLLASLSISILVIHHEAYTRLALAQYLRLANYRVDSAGDWKTAFEQLQQQPTDLVILDLAVVQRVKRNLLQHLLTLYPDMRVVMICDHCSLEDAVNVMKHGAVDVIQEPHGYLQRPFNPERIQAVVAEALCHPLPNSVELTDYDELVGLAQYCAQQHNFDYARQLIGEAIKQAPNRPEGLTLLGQITEYLGDRLAALKLYRAAIGLDPTHQPAQQNLHRAVCSHDKRRPSFFTEDD